jgi:hypothetical protein
MAQRALDRRLTYEEPRVWRDAGSGSFSFARKPRPQRVRSGQHACGTWGVAKAYRDLERVSRRLVLTERLAALLARPPAGLLPTVCYLCQGEDKNASAASATVMAPPRITATSPAAGLPARRGHADGPRWNAPPGCAIFRTAQMPFPRLAYSSPGQVLVEDDRDPPCHAASSMPGRCTG